MPTLISRKDRKYMLWRDTSVEPLKQSIGDQRRSISEKERWAESAKRADKTYGRAPVDVFGAFSPGRRTRLGVRKRYENLTGREKGMMWLMRKYRKLESCSANRKMSALVNLCA